MEVQFDALRNTALLVGAFSRPAVENELTALKARLAEHAGALVIAQTGTAKGLDEAAAAVKAAEADVATATARGGPRELTAARRELVQATEVLAAAEAMAARDRGAELEEIRKKNERPIAAMTEILNVLEAAAIKDLEKAAAGPLARLAAICDARRAFYFYNAPTIANFVASKAG